MVEREVPVDPADLYEARGDVPKARPVITGDVFKDINVPGYDDPVMVMITQHPCSMRQGAVLRKRLEIAVVEACGSIKPTDWQGYASAMLLPDLDAAGKDARADFRDVGAAFSESLTHDKRIAALSNYGIHVLHQRLVYYETRLSVDLPTLAETFDPIATETELQWEWVEAALDAAGDDADELTAIAQQEAAFASYLDENERERRNLLQDSARRADVRRQVRNEIKRRFGI